MNIQELLLLEIYTAEKVMNMYKIGEFSKKVKLPIRTLHYYSDINLLVPCKIEDNGYRYYNDDQILTASRIKAYKDLGFSISEVKELIIGSNFQHQRSLLKDKLQKLRHESICLAAKINHLEEWTSIEKNDNLYSSITMRHIPNYFVAACRYNSKTHKTAFYQRFNEMANLISEHKLQMTGSMMATYHDNWRQYDPHNADIEIFAKIQETNFIDGVTKYWGDFLAVTAFHYGAYSAMSKTYQAMLVWCQDHHLDFTGHGTESYLIDPISTNHPADYVTEIILPVTLKRTEHPVQP